MPRTKQVKNNKIQKAIGVPTDVSSLKTEKDVFEAYQKKKREILDEFDESAAQLLKDFDRQWSLEKIKVNRLKTKDVNFFDFINVFVENGEVSRALIDEVMSMQDAPDDMFLKPPNPTAGSSSGVSSCSNFTSSSSGSARKHPYSASKMVHSSLRRSRSLVKSAQKDGPGSGIKNRRSLSQPSSVQRGNHYKTPIITPKVNPCSTTTVLRLPKTGEMAFSSGGSPMLPTNVMISDGTNKPCVQLPLRDGRVMAVLPKKGRMEETISISPNTKKYLMMLKENLEQIIDPDGASSSTPPSHRT